MNGGRIAKNAFGNGNKKGHPEWMTLILD